MGRSVSLSQLKHTLGSGKRKKVVVLATGVFDILHREHRHFLTRAKAQGELLVVGIESDARVRQLKGEGRPLNPQETRSAAVAAQPAVDYAFILPTDLGTREGRERLIRQLKPQIYAVSENTPFQEEKQRIMKQFGGQLMVVLPHNPRISTTRLIAAKRRDRRSNKSTNI